MTIGRFIKEYRENNNLSVQELADRCNLSKGYISMLENGINPRSNQPIIPTIRTSKKLSSGLGIPLDDVLKLVDSDQEISLVEQPTYENIYPLATKRLPVLGAIACGEPIYADQDRESYVMVGTDINADFCLIAKGDSMIGARIIDGDIVFIRKQDTVNNGEIAAIIIDDEATLKRVYYHSDKNLLILKAENPKYSDMIFQDNELENIHIIGKAVGFQSDVK